VPETVRTVHPQRCHFCEVHQAPGAVVYVPQVAHQEPGGRRFTWEPPVIVCGSCKDKPRKSKLIEARVVAEGATA